MSMIKMLNKYVNTDVSNIILNYYYDFEINKKLVINTLKYFRIVYSLFFYYGSHNDILTDIKKIKFNENDFKYLNGKMCLSHFYQYDKSTKEWYREHFHEPAC